MERLRTGVGCWPSFARRHGVASRWGFGQCLLGGCGQGARLPPPSPRNPLLCSPPHNPESGGGGGGGSSNPQRRKPGQGPGVEHTTGRQTDTHRVPRRDSLVGQRTGPQPPEWPPSVVTMAHRSKCAGGRGRRSGGVCSPLAHPHHSFTGRSSRTPKPRPSSRVWTALHSPNRPPQWPMEHPSPHGGGLTCEA